MSIRHIAVSETRILKDYGILQFSALVAVFFWFLLGGMAHFVYTETEMKILPPWLPEHRMVIFISGFFELLGALGLLLHRTRRLAGAGLILLTVAVTPANIYMWQNPGLFPNIPYWLLSVRLPFQLALLLCIGWATRRR
jgi:uncharacterized membrane protein